MSTDESKLYTEDDVAELKVRAAAARAGVDMAYEDVIVSLAAREKPGDVGKWLDEKKRTMRALFGKGETVKPDTAPIRPTPQAEPAAETPMERWRQLRASGHRDKAEAYYRRNRQEILNALR